MYAAFGVLESEGQSCTLPALTVQVAVRGGTAGRVHGVHSRLGGHCPPFVRGGLWFVLACGLFFSSWLWHKPSHLCVGVRMVKGRWEVQVCLWAALVLLARLTPSKYLAIEQNRAECLYD